MVCSFLPLFHKVNSCLPIVAQLEKPGLLHGIKGQAAAESVKAFVFGFAGNPFGFVKTSSFHWTEQLVGFIFLSLTFQARNIST